MFLKVNNRTICDFTLHYAHNCTVGQKQSLVHFNHQILSVKNELKALSYFNLC